MSLKTKYLSFIERQGYTSSYKYIEERFGAPLKLILCIIYTLNTIIYAGIGKNFSLQIFWFSS